ncbi:MAG: VCBS domain-containing protein, partial [Desulfobacterales bacterium]|nr:VCBS domain-containing protein [Desulfobacterales bacterium]
SITVTPVNDNDPAAVDETITVAEGGTATTLVGGAASVLTNDTDTDLPNDTLSVAVGTGPTNGSLTLNADGTFSYTHDGSENLTDSFTYTVSDADGGVTDSGTVSITITPVNDNNPVAVDENITVAEGGTMTTLVGGASSVLTNDTDTDLPNDTLSVAVGTGPTNGSLTLNADGTFSYTHDGSENLTDSFAYTVSDADGGVTNSGTVSITITPVNDAPVIGGDTAGAVTEDGTLIDTGAITITDADAGEAVFMAQTSADSTGGYGSVDLDAAGNWTYTLNNGRAAVQALNAGETLADSFTAVTADGSTRVVTITITGSNEAPVEDSGSTAGRDDGDSEDVVSVPIPDESVAEDAEDTTVLNPVVGGSGENGISEDAPISTVEGQLPAGGVEGDEAANSTGGPAASQHEEIFYLVDENDIDESLERAGYHSNYLFFDNDLPEAVAFEKHLRVRHTALEKVLEPKDLAHIGSIDFESNDLKQVVEKGDYDQFRNEIDKAFNSEQRSELTNSRIITITSTAFTAGLVGYLFRAGSLAASLVSALPLWRWFDPITIFSGHKEALEKIDESTEEDELNSENFFDGEAK